ncbi:MAG: fatty-acid oxidation protein subunit alpha [Symploca sp. SIO3E6]|nr:fatty-acid oxidation protein subunit alpha [Caldora sp. SIO3E6]
MPAKDIFHDAVKIALEKDGWIILRENFRVKVDEEGLALFIDLAAQKLISAEKNGRKIAVEVKGFQEESNFYQFHAALGQYLNYRSGLREVMPDYILYLAIPLEIYHEFFEIKFIQKRIEEHNLKLLIFCPDIEEIILWKT